MDQYAELYKDRRDRVTKLVLALAALLVLVSADAANRWVTFNDIEPRAQLALFKYCKEYGPELAAWSSAAPGPVRFAMPSGRGDKGRVPSPPVVAIRFQDAGFRDGSLGKGCVDKRSVPFLMASLEEAKLLKVGEETRSVFGFQLSFPVYLVAAVALPSLVLVLIFYDAYGMRSIYGHMKDAATPGAPVPLCANAFAFSRVTSVEREGWVRYVRWSCGWLFLLTWLIPFVGVCLQRWPVVEGVLFVRPLLPPQVEVRPEVPFMHTPVLLQVMSFVTLLNGWICAKIFFVLTAETTGDMPLFSLPRRSRT